MRRAWRTWSHTLATAWAASMSESAEIVAQRYGLRREEQDAFAAESHRPAASGFAAGRFLEEIIPFLTEKLVRSKDGSTIGKETVTLTVDEGIRPDTNPEALAKLSAVWQGDQRVALGRFITAGNSSQLSDGASAQLLMDRGMAEAEGVPGLGVYRGFQVAGCVSG